MDIKNIIIRKQKKIRIKIVIVEKKAAVIKKNEIWLAC
jgi:hypothetical protein